MRTMNRCLLSIAAAGWALAALWDLPALRLVGAQQLDLPETAPQAVLLLHNGQVLTGRVSRSGEYWIVGLASGEIRVRQRDVHLVCRDLQECYRFKRQHIDEGNVRHHLDLGHWCVSHGLLDEAEQQLHEALRAEPRHPRVALLQRQIQLAREPLAVATDLLDAPPEVRGGAPAAFPHELARDDIESFTVAVQPLLVNRCAAAGCHGPDGPSDFKLLRGALGRTGTQRITQYNLRAVLATIDPQQPDESPLLRRAMKAHGGRQHPPLGVADQAALRGLQMWIHQVVRRQPNGHSAGGELPSALAQTLQPLAGSAPAALPGRPQGVAGPRGAPPVVLPEQHMPVAVRPTVPTPAQQMRGDGLPGMAPSGAPRLGDETAPDAQPRDDVPSDMLPPWPQGGPAGKGGDTFTPRDPFDAEIFNRRYGAPRGALPPSGSATQPDTTGAPLRPASAPTLFPPPHR
jgi:hypothetical protein